MRTVPKINPNEWPLSLDEALKRGFFTVQLKAKLQDDSRRREEEETNNFRAIRGEPGTRRRYLIRFPGSTVVGMLDMHFFMHYVSCMKDAKKLARKGGEGTVIQTCTEHLSRVSINGTKILLCSFPGNYTYLKLINGEFQPYTPARMRLADQQGAN